MKGIILAGGNGRRLNPLTDITNKHLLPVYDKPMIYYPLLTLVEAGIDEILIVTGKEFGGGFLRLLGSGKDFGCRLWYEIQDEAGGIAQALGLAEKFADGENMAVILGDNIYENNFKQEVEKFRNAQGAAIFIKEVADAFRFGVAELQGDKVINIEEKPKNPKSNYAVTGMYFYDNTVFDVIKNAKPSARGELEITDVNNHYIHAGQMQAHIINGKWTDAGTFESLYRANTIARQITLQREGKSADEIKQMNSQLLI